MLKERDFISKEEWKKLNVSQRQQLVADLLAKGAKWTRLNKMGASNTLISNVVKDLEATKELKQKNEDKILEVNNAISNLSKIEEVSKKAEEIDNTLQRLNLVEDKLDAVINEKIFLMNDVSVEILREFKKKLKSGELLLDYNKIASEILKG